LESELVNTENTEPHEPAKFHEISGLLMAVKHALAENSKRCGKIMAH